MLFEHYIIGQESTVKKKESDPEGTPFDKIEKKYLAFCRKITYPIQFK